MRVFLTVGVAIVTAASVAAVAAATAATTSLCVGSQDGCYRTIQAAVDRAPDGATIKIAAGNFSGGITINKSLELKGGGADSTVISGGGPVVTIGVEGAATEPTVSITGVTITGGLNTSNEALGGGIYVPSSSSGLGATVAITHSVVAGNRAAPASVAPGCGELPYALGSGGGIDNAGAMTLNDVAVTNNEAGSDFASDADGGGVINERGASLILRNSVVSGNVARVSPPNGRFAAGGGVFTRKGSTLTITATVVGENTVDYSTSVPAGPPCGGFGQAGGIKIGGDESTVVTIRNSTISHNSVLASSSNGDLIAFAGGIDDDGALTLSDSTVSDNRLSATGARSVFLDAGGIEVEGPTTISNTRFTGNSVTANAPTGTALAQAGAIWTASDQLVAIRDSLISGNSASSTTSTGAALVEGGGMGNAGLLELRSVEVSDNNGNATGASGSAQGGGIWNSTIPDGPPVKLTLRDSSVTGNTLSASAGLALQGGGVYTTFPIALTSSLIAKNTPDNCFGC
jgi:hypothetical protein